MKIKQWEYMYERVNDFYFNKASELQKSFQMRGEEGWEVCGIIEGDRDIMVFFKRPRYDE